MTVASFVIIDESGGAKTASGESMDPATLARIADASEVQMNRDFAPHRGGSYRVRSAASGSDIQPGEWVFALLAALPGAPGAIAYHDVNGKGVPVLYDAITLSDTLIGPGNSVSVAITHEIPETAGDPPCNVWCDDLTGDVPGLSYAYEACDAVEAQTYVIDGTGVSVSNWLLPVFFTPNADGPYDFLSTIAANPDAPKAPFQTASGGYQIVRSMGNGEHQVTARHYAIMPVTITVSATIPFGMRRAWRHGSRRARRGVAA